MTPQSMTEAMYSGSGWMVSKVMHAFGFIDVIAMPKPDRTLIHPCPTHFVISTMAGKDYQHVVSRLKLTPNVRHAIASGNAVIIHAWSKAGKGMECVAALLRLQDHRVTVGEDMRVSSSAGEVPFAGSSGNGYAISGPSAATWRGR